MSGPAGRPAPLKDTEIEVASMGRTHRDHAAADIASHALVEAVAPGWKVSGFSGDIKGLVSLPSPEKVLFLLA
jgi:hypothetical protein